MDSEEVKEKKAQELIDKFTDSQGEIDVNGVAKKVVEVKTENKNLKKVIAWGAAGILVAIGMMT